MEYVGNLGHSVSEKTVSIQRLSKDQKGQPSYVVLGTPRLDVTEIYELQDVLRHEIKHRAQQAVKQAKEE